MLKYLGEQSTDVSEKLKSAVAISVPMDLEGCSIELSKGFNLIYTSHFMQTLRKKVKYVKNNHDHYVLKDINPKKLKTFLDFDELVTAPLYGFSSREDFWAQSSSKFYLKKIKIPTIIINAKNDPFLSDSCYPDFRIIDNSYISYLYPEVGGHVGFVYEQLNGTTLTELESIKFVEKNTLKKIEKVQQILH